jgi:aldehyde dehydrogenase (NAD+)
VSIRDGGSCRQQANRLSKDSGQVCTASSRVYVQRSAAEAFKRLLVARFETLKLGSPTSTDTDLGPQADATQVKSIASFLEVGKKEGTVLTGGEQSNVGANYIRPTIFAGIQDDSRINVEEVFGPVLVLHEFDTEMEVVERANDTECKSQISIVHGRIANQDL